MEKRIAEISNSIIPQLEDDIFRFERECECKKPDCHKQLKARHLKEQIQMLDNERRELKEKVNNRSRGNGFFDYSNEVWKDFFTEIGGAANNKPTKEEWEQEKSSQGPNEDYSLTTITGRKYGGSCFDCGATGTVEMITYFSCDLCGEKNEGDVNWRCEKCNDKKFRKHSCKHQKKENEREKDKTNPSQSPINITINNNVGQGNGDNALENKKLEQIVQEIELLKEKIAQLEKTGSNPQKVQELKHQVQNLETQKQAQFNQQKPEPVEKKQEIKEKETIPNSAPAKPENYKTMLLIGGGLLIAGALVIGYFLGKSKKQGGKEEEN
ncbi:MAG: hypothetical protein MRECE_8c028 [Mycoplasmataceae bacterium CE_OT135]|nr:MAG: hypothetical protein MRECE_8c028 [Mycoplasmataceae bacterium CE_OT135]